MISWLVIFFAPPEWQRCKITVFLAEEVAEEVAGKAR